MINSKRITHKSHKQVMRKRMGIPHKATTCEKVGLISDEGHFVIYTIDRSRFVIPLDYLNRPIFKEVPCEAFVMEHIDSLFRKNAPKEWRKH
ncbi:hypothetical protein AMTRI_Chr09g14590 [Amborella trichopoda]